MAIIESKAILCLDFDGVCHAYTSGWQGATVVTDRPVDGLFRFLEEAYAYFDIYVYSSRSHAVGGIEAMRRWFCFCIPQEYSILSMVEKVTVDSTVHEVESIEVLDGTRTVYKLYLPEYKPSAIVTIDDRAVCFTGQWPSVEQLRSFKPWNKR